MRSPRISRFRSRLGAALPAAALLVAAALPPLEARAGDLFRASANVPIGHRAYRDVQKLAGFGLILGDVQGTLPWSRAEFARLIVEADARAPGLRKELGDAFEPYLARLKREFADEIDFSGRAAFRVPYDTFLKPADDLRVRVLGGDFETRLTATKRTSLREGTPLLHNQEGALASERWTVLLDGGAVGRLWSGIAFAAHPLAAFRDGGDLGDLGERGALDRTADVQLHKGYLKLGFADTEVEVGRDSLWWGPAKRSSLILSNEATPLELVKVSNPEPILLPWILRYLGLVKAVGFAGRLDLQRTASTVRPEDRLHPVLAGMRLQLKPLPWLELGAARAIVFRTKRADGSRLSGRDVLKILAGVNIAGPDDTSNQLAGFDALVRLPFLRNAEVYAQSIGEDEAGFLPTKESYLGGVYVPRVLSDGSVDLRVEATMTHEVYGLSSTFLDGYTHRRLALGSPAGPDALEIWGRATWDATPEATLAVEGQYWKRSAPADLLAAPPGGAGDETSYGGKAEIAWRALDWLEATAEAGAEQVSNFNFSEGRDRLNVLAAVGLRLDF